MVGLAIAGIAATAIGATYSAISSYRQGEAAEQAAKAQAKALQAQAAENERQAVIAQERAGIAQVQGEQQAEMRSRQLASEIGSAYANWAGNGLLVEGAPGDTFGNVLSSTVTEAESDISTIRDNAAIDVWTHQNDAYGLLATASNQRADAQNTLIQGRYAKSAAKMNALGTLIGGYGKAATGAYSIWG